MASGRGDSARAGRGATIRPMFAVHAQALEKRFQPGTTWGDLLRGRLRRPPVQALRGVDLTVRPGELVGLAGPNGAGKSTLLRAIGGLLLPDVGQVHVFGRATSTHGVALRRDVGYAVADERSYFWRLTGRQNLAFFAALHGLGSEEARDRVDAALEVVDLVGPADRAVREYSTGMRQRLGLARSLLGDPRVLLLDEPTRGLDPRSAGRIRRFVCDELVGKRGMAVLYATHQIDEMRVLCPRLVLLAEGRVVGDGPFADLGDALSAVFG